MDTTAHVQAVRGDLESAAGTDDASAQLAERLVRAVDASLHLRLLDALGEAAQELSELLPGGHVEVRLAGRDARFVFVPEGEPTAMPADDDGGTARLTLRMPEGLKTRVEQAAVAEGMSTNAWLVHAIARNLDQRRTRRTGTRVTGYARS